METKNNDWLLIGDSPRDIGILQSERKMKPFPGQKVKISFPKANQTAKTEKSFVIKGVSAEVTEHEFKEFLDLNKISYAKAERLKSKIDSRALEMFKLETKDDTEARLLLQN